MAHTVKCRLCKKSFDIDKEEGVVIGTRSYYHKKCYDEWISVKDNPKAVLDEDFWKESLIDYLYRDIKMSIDFSKIDNQWKNFINPNRKMTPKGIYFATKYFYEIQKGDIKKAQGGIGIVPLIYKESAAYWTDLELRKAGTIDAIIAQILHREARPIQSIKKEKIKKEKNRFSLEEI